MRRRIPTIALVALGTTFVGIGAASSAGAQEPQEGDLTICHRTNSNANPYIVITTDQNGQNGGTDHFGEHTGPIWNPTLKAQHIEWGDIIPPSEAHPDGLNWTEEGQAFWENDCNVPPVPTGDVTLDKVTTGGTAPAGTTAFAFTVVCESGSVPNAAPSIAPDDVALTVATGVAEDDQCTITETEANGATSTSFEVTGGTEVSDAGGAVTFSVTSTSVSVVATNGYPEPVVPETPQTPVVQGVQITTTTAAPTTTTAVVAGVQLARTGSPAGFWYVMSGLAFLLGGLSFYGSTARRLLFVKR